MDITVPYVWTTPAGVITFNHTGIDRFNMLGGVDEYYLVDSDGLDGVEPRTPTDKRPSAHGGLVYPRLDNPREFALLGALVIRSTSVGNSIRIKRNEMEEELREAWNSCDDADSTLVWTPSGRSQISLTCRKHTPKLDFDGIEWRTFVFGLIAADPGY